MTIIIIKYNLFTILGFFYWMNKKHLYAVILFLLYTLLITQEGGSHLDLG